jgi:hypothetical protein
LSQARLADGDSPGSRAAAQQAMGLVDALAGQLDEPALQASFLQSALVTGIRDGLQP